MNPAALERQSLHVFGVTSAQIEDTSKLTPKETNSVLFPLSPWQICQCCESLFSKVKNAV